MLLPADNSRFVQRLGGSGCPLPVPLGAITDSAVTVGLSISRRCAGREPEQAERGPDGVPQGRLHAEREEWPGPWAGAGIACS